MNAELILEGLLLPTSKRNVLLILKRLDRSIFLTPCPWSWYRCLFLPQPEACRRSSGLASECHLGRRGVCRNWSRGVMDHNRHKPKYEHGILTGKCKRLKVWNESTTAWCYADWGGCTHRYSNILVVWETCMFSVNLPLLQFNPNEDISTIQPSVKYVHEFGHQ